MQPLMLQWLSSSTGILLLLDLVWYGPHTHSAHMCRYVWLTHLQSVSYSRGSADGLFANGLKFRLPRGAWEPQPTQAIPWSISDMAHARHSPQTLALMNSLLICSTEIPFLFALMWRSTVGSIHLRKSESAGSIPGTSVAKASHLTEGLEVRR